MIIISSTIIQVNNKLAGCQNRQTANKASHLLNLYGGGCSSLRAGGGEWLGKHGRCGKVWHGGILQVRARASIVAACCNNNSMTALPGDVLDWLTGSADPADQPARHCQDLRLMRHELADF